MYIKHLILLGTLLTLVRPAVHHHFREDLCACPFFIQVQAPGQASLGRVEEEYDTIINHGEFKKFPFDVDQHGRHEISDITVNPTIMVSI